MAGALTKRARDVAGCRLSNKRGIGVVLHVVGTQRKNLGRTIIALSARIRIAYTSRAKWSVMASSRIPVYTIIGENMANDMIADVKDSGTGLSWFSCVLENA